MTSSCSAAPFGGFGLRFLVVAGVAEPLLVAAIIASTLAQRQDMIDNRTCRCSAFSEAAATQRLFFQHSATLALSCPATLAAINLVG